MTSRLISVPGKPKGKGRPRMARGGWVYTPGATRRYEKLLRQAYSNKYGNAQPLSGPLKVIILASFGKPARSKRPYPARPDLDNIIKIAMDALNGLAWVDDSQVVSIQAEKFFFSTSKLVIIIQEALGLSCL